MVSAIRLCLFWAFALVFLIGGSQPSLATSYQEVQAFLSKPLKSQKRVALSRFLSSYLGSDDFTRLSVDQRLAVMQKILAYGVEDYQSHYIDFLERVDDNAFLSPEEDVISSYHLVSLGDALFAWSRVISSEKELPLFRSMWQAAGAQLDGTALQALEKIGGVSRAQQATIPFIQQAFTSKNRVKIVNFSLRQIEYGFHLKNAAAAVFLAKTAYLQGDLSTAELYLQEAVNMGSVLALRQLPLLLGYYNYRDGAEKDAFVWLTALRLYVGRENLSYTHNSLLYRIENSIPAREQRELTEVALDRMAAFAQTQKILKIAQINPYEVRVYAINSEKSTLSSTDFISLLRSFAGKSQGWAVELLAQCYERGIGVSANMVEAVNLYKRMPAYAFSDPYRLRYYQAQMRLGAIYLNGIGVSADQTIAVSYYRRAPFREAKALVRKYEEFSASAKDLAIESNDDMSDTTPSSEGGAQ